ncbi:MAG: acetyltransferase [Pseudomonadota bacterium]
MVSIRPSRPDDGLRVLAIWAAAVDATHHFLTDQDRHAIGEEVATFLPHAPLLVAVDDHDVALAFMMVAERHLEALFVDPGHHRAGIGKAMVRHALDDQPGLSVDVNAQNDGAATFYEHIGFVETGRSSRDGQGRPYPLIHLRHKG